MISAFALTGPTASGKTAISLYLAGRLGAEIISCDSMQIYRGMDIGTAKATPEERAAVPHHMIDFLSPDVSYSTEDYRRDALLAAEEIVKRGNVPLFVGGTGLYVDTLMRGAVASPPSDPELRETLMREAAVDGGRERLWQRLCEVDQKSAAATHANNVRRVVRALEIYELSGVPKSRFDELSKAAAPDISIRMLTLDFHDRDNLYKRVDKRVDIMVAEGLIPEVEALYQAGLLRPEYTASQAIGYKEIVSYLEGKCSLDEAIELIKLSSRRYAKRQLTWFRHVEGAERLYIDDEQGRIKSVDTLTSEAYSLLVRD